VLGIGLEPRPLSFAANFFRRSSSPYLPSFHTERRALMEEPKIHSKELILNGKSISGKAPVLKGLQFCPPRNEVAIQGA
jgi:hypothetical protein